MKKIIEDVEGEGLMALLGENVLIFCMRYNYSGKLTGVNDTDILLEDAQIVFDTGDLSDANWTTAETPINSTLRVRTSAIESYVATKV
jgi:hypothetical protein